MEEDFTLLEKVIILLLYLKDKTPIFGKTKLQKMIFLISQEIPELEEELDFEAYRYGMYDQTIEEILDGLQKDGFIKIKDDQIILQEEAVKRIQEISKDLKEKISILEEVKDLLNDLAEDEMLVLMYFKFPEFARYSEKKKEIERKRKEFAISLYLKGKISIEAASEIAGVSIKEFLEILKKRRLA